MAGTVLHLQGRFLGALETGMTTTEQGAGRQAPWAGGRATSLLPLAVFAFGAFVSLRYSLGLWQADPDLAIPFVLLKGLLGHGPHFLSTWLYSQDNWLLSLMPLAWAFLGAAPGHPRAIIVLGWAMFIASALLAGLLTARAGRPRRAIWLSCVLVFANYQALGAAGFLSYPVTHNSSLLWALLATLLGGTAISRRSEALAFAAGLCVFVDAISDPWAAAGVALPLILAAAALAVMRFRAPERRTAVQLCLYATVAFALAETRVLGLLAFLPPTQFSLTTPEGMLRNAGWAVRALACTFNLLPGADPQAPVATAIDAGVLFALLTASAVLILRRIPRQPPERQFVWLAALLSLAGVGLAFLIGQWPPGLYLGRFFPNFYFFGGVMIASAPWPRASRPLRATALLLASLFVASGLFSRPGLWTLQVPQRNENDIRALGDFLRTNGLTYGYGPYWGAYALSMDWITGGRVVIRPVTFRTGRVSPRGAEVSPLWYEPGAEPSGLDQRFLVIRHDVDDECPSPARCVDMAIAQFGRPWRRLAYKDAVILVWRRPLAGRFGPLKPG